MARYRISVQYTGEGGQYWREETNSLGKINRAINEHSGIYTQVTVWDNIASNFLYLKRVLDYKPEIDRRY